MSTTSTKRLPEQFGRYRIQRLIGEGGMGAVYLARDEQLGRDVALKVPQFADGDGTGVLDRFYQEARAAATVHHPNICPVFDVGEIDKIHYLTMAFIDGISLERWAIGEKTITTRQLAVLVRKIALAMHEAHKKGVIHRDLKPSNIMIDRRGEPIVMDFGLARRIEPGDQRLTRSGAIMGSPSYMAPEQVKGEQKAIGPATDIYALGVILYELLTHRLPFVGEDNLAVLAQVLLDEPPPPLSFRSDLDEAIEFICLKAMAKRSEDRYASMADLANALQDYLRGSPKPPEAKPAEAAITIPPTNDRTNPPGIRASQMGGLQSMAGLQMPVPSDRRLDTVQPKRRRRRQSKRGQPIGIWIVGGVGGVLVITVIAVIASSKVGGARKSANEPGVVAAIANPPTKSAPAATSPAPVKDPPRQPDRTLPEPDRSQAPPNNQPGAAGPSIPHIKELTRKIDEAMQTCRDKIGCTAGALAIDNDRGPIYSHAYGWIDERRNTPATLNTMFPIGRGSWVILAASIRQLAADKQFDLSDSCFKLLEIKPNGNVIDPRIWSISVSHLLEDKAGWNDDFVEEARRTAARLTKSKQPPVEAIMRILATRRLKDAPGGEQRRSELDVEILERLGAKFAGMPLVDYYRTKLMGREFRGVALMGKPEIGSDVVWNSPIGSVCITVPALLEFTDRFGGNSSWQMSQTSYFNLWRSDGIRAAVLFNGGGRGEAIEELIHALNELLDLYQKQGQ